MRKYIFVLILTIGSTFCMAGELVLTGIYQGSNLYVMNPFAPVGEGFCVTEVQVNGAATSDEINSSAFEVDLGALSLDRKILV